MEPGDTVTISYMGYTVEAKLLEHNPMGTYGPLKGWWMVEQITDFEDKPEGQRPTYEAAEEYIVPSGQPPAPGPFSALAITAGLSRAADERIAMAAKIGQLQIRAGQLETALKWVTDRYEDTLAQRSVRDADEAILHARNLLKEATT